MTPANKKKFYNSLRKTLNLTTQNVFGTEKIIAYAELTTTPLQHLKYIMATAWWESGQTMTPVEEGFYLGSKKDAFQKKLRYYPWFGRGLVQITWQENYEKLWKILGRTGPVDRGIFLEWDTALPVLFIGMEMGLFTGKADYDYIDLIDESDDEDLREMVNARRVVNGTDKAATIARLGLLYEKALKAGGYKH